jgi:hypothetical protein
MTDCRGKLWFAILLVVATILLFVVQNTGFTAEGVSTFVRLQFGSDVSVEVPRNWIFLDQNIRQHLNTYSEAVAKLSGIDVNQGNNQILVAANAYTNSKKPSATMRLSVRVGSFPSQSEIKFADLAELRQDAELSLRRLQGSLPDDVRGMKLIDVRVERLGGYYTIVTDQQIDYVYGSALDRLDVISVGSKNYKLYTSYQKSEAWMFGPIIQHIRQSLRITTK